MATTTPLPPQAGRINWADLSPESVAILRQVVVPIHLEGCTATETAKRLEIPIGSVKLLVKFFADEVTQLAQPDS